MKMPYRSAQPKGPFMFLGSYIGCSRGIMLKQSEGLQCPVFPGCPVAPGGPGTPGMPCCPIGPGGPNLPYPGGPCGPEEEKQERGGKRGAEEAVCAKPNPDA